MHHYTPLCYSPHNILFISQRVHRVAAGCPHGLKAHGKERQRKHGYTGESLM